MPDLRIASVTPDRWDDLERVFGPNGAYSGCWCMYLRESAREFDDNLGAGNRERFRRIVRSGAEPGLLAYDGGEPVGWVAVAPRHEYARVLRSPLHQPLDASEQGVFAITCFFVARSHRRRGVAEALLDAAIHDARRRGARAVEAYPSKDGGTPAEMWRGSRAMFERVGFRPVVERRPGRPVLRLDLA